MRRSLRPLGVALFMMGVGACTSTATGPGVSPPPATITPLAIEDLTVDEPAWSPDGSDWALQLSWRSTPGSGVDRYVVRRNGTVMDDQVRAPSWTDPSAEPGRRYTYSVAGFTEQGDRVPPARTTIRTGTPPLADARLDGRFVVVLRALTSTGTHDRVQGGKTVFRFEPGCATGPCSVRWTVRGLDTEMLLRRDGARYHGRGRTPLLIRNCYGTPVDERVVARLRVTGADALRGHWRATRVRGIVHERSSWDDCATASISWRVRGVLHSGGDGG